MKGNLRIVMKTFNRKTCLDMKYPIPQEKKEASCQITYLASYLFILVHSVDLSIICIDTAFYQYILFLK